MENSPTFSSLARLGLSEPQSPDATVPSTPPSSQKITERGTPIFTLPPQRRAQLLLHEMAGLTSRLFEVSSNNAEWVAAYRGSIPTFLQGSCIPPEAAAATTTKDILSILKSHQKLLEETVPELQEIQKIEQDKQVVAQEIASKDSAMRAFARKLRDAQKVLEKTLEDYTDYRIVKRSKTLNPIPGDALGLGHLDLDDIVKYAHTLSYTTFAPPEFGAGQAPLRGAMPPAPQEEQMRASRLFQFADLDVGIPKQAVLEPLPVALVEPPPEKVVVNPKPEFVPSMVPGLPPVPSGWRPGMPIELPVMPPGWKPGDPVPLPPVEAPVGWKPGDAVVLPKPEEAAQAPPPRPAEAPPLRPAAPAKPAEPIQVRYVQLDINPGMQDESSSEYSATSEEEDDAVS